MTTGNKARAAAQEAKILGQVPAKEKPVLEAGGLIAGELFTKKAVWRVKAQGGIAAAYTGVELEQMISPKAKQSVLNGARKFVDGRLDVEFKGLNR